jgi:hypothetical protein
MLFTQRAIATLKKLSFELSLGGREQAKETSAAIAL